MGLIGGAIGRAKNEEEEEEEDEPSGRLAGLRASRRRVAWKWPFGHRPAAEDEDQLAELSFGRPGRTAARHALSASLPLGLAAESA